MQLNPPAVMAVKDRYVSEVFSTSAMQRLRSLVDLEGSDQARGLGQAAQDRVLAQAEVMFTGWGTARVDGEVLDRAPKLRAIIHTAGTVKTILDREVFDRGIRVSSCARANAIPVAEYTVAMITLGRKRAGRFAHQLRSTNSYRDERGMPGIGLNGVRVGLVGASMVGREVIRLLRSYNVTVGVFDPYLSRAQAAALQVHALDLDELCRWSDVLSIHAPLNPSTVGMIGAPQLAQLRDGAVVINTARGPIVDEAALEDEVESGRIDAFLDVTDPEPLPSNSPLFRLSNAFVTPHIAGALGNEVERLGDMAVAEVESWVKNEELPHEIYPADLDRIA